ncbi:MAG: T9SS type A sorting domain-containing protein [Bacteroidota bacterium]
MTHSFFYSNLLLLLLVASNTASYAQSPCQGHMAEVEDTLSAEGYAMLALGNVWEYERNTGAFFGGVEQVTVIGDTTVQNLDFFVLSRAKYTFLSNGTLSTPSSSRIYRTVRDGITVEYDAARDELTHTDIPLNSPFNACYELTRPLGAASVLVTGALDTTVSIGASTVTVASLKRFTEELTQTSGATEYAHGIGLVERSGGQDTRTRLAYAKIGEHTWGTSPLDRYVITSTDPKDPIIETGLSLYPNPASDVLYVQSVSSSKCIQSIELYDMLGRKVYSSFENTCQSKIIISINLNIGHLPAGLYIVVASTRTSRNAALVHILQP